MSVKNMFYIMGSKKFLALLFFMFFLFVELLFYLILKDCKCCIAGLETVSKRIRSMSMKLYLRVV